ncbi:transcriptional regulator [Ureibacillus aquaedulcis]|uniref:Transcriptional regulator n=1 Tax=Ureibacillus aquaedulcis TaxID=3058421 RepID=A0ABT8GNZ1_9BACL|nr:transcriptional regulator [Ureibacillus sp. BA0131]MDN4492641.1 transcriptional regulator [Ureibacillus sp. BA0131]
MSMYREGYNYYKQACEQYELEPLNFAFYLLSLSKEQLDAYNEKAELKRGHDLDN